MDKKIVIPITRELHGKRIKYILSFEMGISSTLLKRIKRSGGILLNGEEVSVIREVYEGQELMVTVPERTGKEIIPANLSLDILYEDEDMIAVNKPRNMPTHPSPGHHTDTLLNALAHYFEGRVRVHAITRLDRDTSGVVLLAKNALSAKILTDEIQAGEIGKEYVAIINGCPEKKEGKISAPIKKREDSAGLQCISPDGKEAVSEYRVEQTENGLSMVSLFPKTGRTHQLRVHMSHLGCPIFGDDLYGAPQGKERIRLHCKKISFLHPIRKEKMEISAPMPEDMNLL